MTAVAIEIVKRLLKNNGKTQQEDANKPRREYSNKKTQGDSKGRIAIRFSEHDRVFYST